MLRPILLAMTILMIPLAADASWVDLGGPPGSSVRSVVLEDGPQGTVVEFTLSGFYIRDVEMDGEKACLIRLPQSVTFLEEGLPELPRSTRCLIIPDDAHMSSEILETT